METFMDVFTWSAWDQFDNKVFYDCTLLMDIGDYQAGYTFDLVIFNDKSMTLEFFLNDVSVPVMTKRFQLIV